MKRYNTILLKRKANQTVHWALRKKDKYICIVLLLTLTLRLKFSPPALAPHDLESAPVLLD